MIVDDSRYMRAMLSDILTGDGHHVAGEAENAMEAVELYRRLRPDLVTLDIIMPEVEGMNSIEALKAILLEDVAAKVVIVSSMGQQDIVAEHMEAGARDFIVKPFQPRSVAGAVRRVLEE